MFFQEYLMGRLWRRGSICDFLNQLNLGIPENITPSELPGYVVWEYLSYMYDRSCYKKNIPFIVTTSVSGHIAYNMVLIYSVQQIILNSN